MIGATLAGLGPWVWVLLGLVLIGLELLAPGVFFLWLGLAALATGAVDGLLGLSWQTALLVFAGLSLGAVLAGRALTGRRDDAPQPASLNRRGQNLVGRLFVLEAPILGGEGRVRVGDSSWRVTGADAPAGTSVRVERVEGSTLVVTEASSVTLSP